MESTGKQTSHDHKHRIEEEDEAITYAGVLSSSFILPMVLNACIELNVLEIINKAGPDAQLRPSAIASQLPTGRNPDAPFVLDRMLHLLASYSLLTCSVHTLEDGKVQRRYGLTLAGKCFIRSVDRASLAPFSLLSRCQAITNMGFHLKARTRCLKVALHSRKPMECRSISTTV
ncbi:caffeic acid 3-O-methyltransferase-like [Alnus glutinosa]|uniref:caffeic acid 3-O-methyltransferase-like n=1 Tax=Alnus glutinosa TaxID=3517 RepID=UPI002D76A5B5|nr:caffeic acid 3-O-methyltransferase-like [Alnus glutinosa]